MDEPVVAGSLPVSRFCSDDFAPADRLEAWSESVSLLFRPSLAPGVTPARCSVTTEAYLVGSTMLGSSRVSGIGGYHNPGSSVRREGPDLVVVDLVCRGRDVGYNGGRAFEAGQGDISILDPSRGLGFRADPESVGLTFLVPRRQLQELVGKRVDLSPLVLRGRSAAGRILTQAMRTAWARLPRVDAGEAAEVSGLLVGALAGLIRGTSDRADPALDHATLDAICAYIDRHLDEPDLGPEHLCKRFHCSRARLYRLFAPLDGIASYIRKARLERCHAALLAASRKDSITDLALESGFGSVSHFNRLFRRTYGVTPGEVRGIAALGGGAPVHRPRNAPLRVPEYREWLAQL